MTYFLFRINVKCTQVNPSGPKWTQVNSWSNHEKTWRTYSSNLIWNEPKWTQVTPDEPKWTQVNPSSNHDETTTHFLFRINSVHLHAKQYQSTIKAKQSQVNPSEAKRRQAELSLYMCTLRSCLLCRTFVAQLFWSSAATLFVRQCLSVSKRW